MRTLPSLHAIRVFEVCARLCSFSAAARELCLTHSAVSHQIRQLEESLAAALFTRHADGVQPTAAGRLLAEAASAALTQLETACARVRSVQQPQAVRLAAPASFLALWLIRRLEDFERNHSQVRLQLQTQGDLSDLAAQRIDALVLSAKPPWPRGFEVTTLFADRAGPVCAPDFPGVPRTPAELLDQPLLCTLSRPEAWHDWARAHGLATERLKLGRHFDNLQLMLEAAVARLGMAIAPQRLVERDLEQGRLIAPLGFDTGSSGFALCLIPSRQQEPALASLREWMRAQAAQEYVRAPERNA